MDLNLDDSNALLVYKALASDTRIDILKIISKSPSTVSEISQNLGYSKAIISRYMKILENAHLIKCARNTDNNADARKKIYYLTVDHIEIELPKKIFLPYKKKSQEIKLGYFSDFSVQPTCGLAGSTKRIGNIDDTRTFALNDRIEASLLWFSAGYVEYVIPNSLNTNTIPELLEISMEISSEFPGSNNVWPSDISFFINNIKLGISTVPGNFSDVRGKLTPSWWDNWLSQYGLLKSIRINHEDTSVNGQKISDITLEDLKLTDNHFIKLRLEIEKDSINQGGLTIFGSDFGNHPQNIICNMYYSETDKI